MTNKIYLLIIIITLFNSSCTKMVIPNYMIDQENITKENSLKLYNNKSIKNELDKIAERLIESKYNIGLVVAILHNDTTNIYNYGYADKDSKKNMDTNTIFAIGSNTKMIINSLALVLESKGLIDFDETIGDILPKNLIYADSNVRNISLRSLALHSSGLPREPNDFKTSKTMLSYISTGNHIYRHIDKEYMYSYLQRAKLNKKKNATYSNIGGGLFAHLITLKTGESLENLLQEHLLKDLNMINTSLELPKDNEKIATGYVGDFPPLMKKNKPLKNWEWSDVMIGTGGAYSTANDLMQIAKAHLSISNTYLDTIFNKAHQTYTYDGELYYTLAWQVKKFKKSNTTIHYKYGVIAGFSCYVGINVKTNDAIVVLKNNFNWKDEIGHNILLQLNHKNKL